jgi:hypothetical protein
MFLSLYYLSDVLDGFLVGGFWLMVAVGLSGRRPPGAAGWGGQK